MPDGCPSPGEGGASVISKAAKILQAFSPERPRLTLAGLSLATGMSPSTTLRRATDLLRCGLLERNAEGQFYIGVTVQRIAAAAPAGAILREVALPVMQDIFTLTRYDVALIVRDGTAGLILERLYGATKIGLLYTHGYSAPLHATGGGLALLADLPAEVQDQVLAEPLPALTPYTLTDPDELRARFARTRANGYVVSAQGSNVHTTSIGVPIFNASAEAVAGLSVVMKYDSGGPPRALIDTARVGARMISRQLGAPRTAFKR